MFKWGSPKKREINSPAAGSGRGGSDGSVPRTTKALGDQAESRALHYLQARGLTLVERNYRVAAGPHARGGEIDLIMRDREGTLVFVEVRGRRASNHGGAAASVTSAKQQRLIYAAQHYLQRFNQAPPCRFDVVALDEQNIEWLRAAFDAGPQ